MKTIPKQLFTLVAACALLVAHGMWAGAPRTYTDVTQYTEGTLVLNFVDARTKRLVFRGIAKAVLGGPESNARKIEEAMAKVVAECPK